MNNFLINAYFIREFIKLTIRCNIYDLYILTNIVNFFFNDRHLKSHNLCIALNKIN